MTWRSGSNRSRRCGLEAVVDRARQPQGQALKKRSTLAQLKSAIRPGNFDFEEVSMIIEARVDELLEYIDKELRKK